ncbi:MAG: hypothetical protein AAF726_02980 [Planctomycetota bacterium]
MKTISIVGAAAILHASAAAQVTVMTTEQFDYMPPALLENQAGGTGWVDSWGHPVGNGNEVVVFDPSVNPPMPCRDAVGNYAGQAQEFFAIARTPSQVGQLSVVENGKFGADGAIIWFSFRTQMYQQFFGPSGSFGALQLFDTASPNAEQLLLGSPFSSSNFEWGWDDDAGTGFPPVSDPNTDASVCARLVFRIDHLPGNERIRMWVDPVADFPALEAPNLDSFISDLRWDQIRLNSGGNGTHFFWDDIIIARGEPLAGIGTSYCGPAVVNSSGQSGEIIATGSTIATDNNVLLTASGLPQTSFGFFLTSLTTGFVVGPGGSQGNLCLGGNIGRYVGTGQIQNSGLLGTFSLGLNLNATPTPTGFVTIMAGETWNFQSWFRDAVGGSATSNFTDGVTVNFQ